jgi:vacuolar-type H+-ATPase subunit H
MGTDGPARRREIEDSTAARLAEIVAAAERAAKQVIDEAEEEARTRLSDADEEADRIVAARLAGLADLTDEIGAQAEALVRQAEALQQALARAKAEMGGGEALGGPATMGRREAEPAARKPSSPSLTVIAGVPEEPARGARMPKGVPDWESAAANQPEATEPGSVVPEGTLGPDADEPTPPESISGTPAGARLLATQMAVSGSSREEIESRLRSGFAIADTRSILDAILGPEN